MFGALAPSVTAARPARAYRALAAAALGVMTLVGCSETVPTSSAGAQTLTVGVFQNPDSLDPGVTGLITSSQILLSMFDPLIWRFPGDSKWYPGLAESFEASSDGTTYTFKLRKDVKFHDGTPLNAEAVKATFDHIADPATKSRTAVGQLGPYKETKVIDEYTAQVSFTKPNLSFLNEVSLPSLGISSPTALKKYGADYGQHPIGTGPFVFKEFASGSRVVVTRNPDYHWGPASVGSGPAKLASITFRVLSDPTTQMNALSTGEIQVAQNLTPQDVVSAVGAGKQKLTAPSRGMPYGLLVNAAKAPTDDVAVRQALEFAVDRNAIIQTLFRGLYTPATSVLTPDTPGFQESQDLYPHDKAKAQALLDRAGWTAGADGRRSRGGQPLKIQLINISDFGFDGISQLVQAQLKDVGFEVEISNQAFPAVGTTYNQGQHNLADWFYYDVDPYQLDAIFSCAQVKAGFNWAHYCDPGVDAKITQANGTVDENQRSGLYHDVIKTLVEQAVFVPLYNLQSIMVTAPSVKNVKFTINGQPLFHAALG
jgi:peptide/nickel transport system substrate-binding protein